MSRPCLDDRRGVGVRLRSAVFGCLLGLALAGAWVAGARALDPAPDQDALVTLAQLVETEHRRVDLLVDCLLYTSPSPRDGLLSRMPSSA